MPARPGVLRVSVATLVAALVAMSVAVAAPQKAVAWGPAEAAAAPAWLVRVNLHRKLAGLPPVTANAVWGNGARLHSRYIVKNGQVTHFEDPSNPWYTKAGYEAGLKGNVAAFLEKTTADSYAIDYWMQGPFHAIGIIHPHLVKVGYGAYREDAAGFYGMGATLNVISGRDYSSPDIYPSMYPSGKQPMVQRWYTGGEHPNPLASCPGYTAPSGPAIMLMLGDNQVVPRVTAHIFKQGGKALAHCIFDETNYKNPNHDDQALGRASLDQADMIVIMPRAPLERGKTYTVSITTGGKKYTWSFKVAASAP